MKSIGKIKIGYQEVIKLPLTEFREVWLVHNQRRLRIDRSGQLLYDDTYYNSNDMRSSYSGKFILGTYNNLVNNEPKIISKLQKYITDNEIITDSPKDYLLGILNNSGYDLDYVDEAFKRNDIVIILDKPSKKLAGRKEIIKVNIKISDFNKEISSNDISINIIDLEVFCTKFSEDAIDIKYSAYIPADLYKAAMNLPTNERPQNRVIESVLLSDIKKEIEELADKVYQSKIDDYFCKHSSKKYIYIIQKNGKTPIIDDYNFGFVGDNISINFRYFIGYEYKGSFNDTYYYVDKHRFDLKEHMNHHPMSKYREDKFKERKFHIKFQDMRNLTRIVWTEERENYLKQLELKFEQLISNLESFMVNVNDDSIDELINNNNNIFLLNSGE